MATNSNDTPATGKLTENDLDRALSEAHFSRPFNYVDTSMRNCPPCNTRCDQGRTCPEIAQHTDGDPDGLGTVRGLGVALAIVTTIVVLIVGGPILIDILSR